MEVEGAIIKAAGIIVYTVDALAKEVKYLLLKASNKPFHWTPPKGNVYSTTSPDERVTPTHQAYRALRPRYKAHDRDKECVYYLGKLTDPDSKITLSHEHIDHAWVSASNINEYCDKESLCNMIAHAEEHIKGKLH
ncbi:DIADENOSINE 5,5-P1,P4-TETRAPHOSPHATE PYROPHOSPHOHYDROLASE MUTT,putative [Babesia bigemina]|uniref:DIADENOSINE 5,5-P1,P4-TETRAPHOSPHATE PYROPHOSPHOHYDROLASE MUTT,putative n=1 Tax=Babesia bigemina TaxID=5866 RepID=A0A061D2X1_BABBI|nr:DIADENOSINE 5,5-P1,P4-TETRAPHOSPHATE PYROPHOSPHOHYDROLASE MUTT,putative [Babesia bigemina]CDR95121.1 DIADENOSINE 5,5-P1,P4-TETRAPHOSPHATE PYROPHOSPHOHYDROLASE MUTT,putative [Babesia bigemina]|eukprot:XP_012767307.1 DIADENOSINE 5,5-P1,P4-TETRAPHOSPHATE PYROPHOSPHOHYDROLASE MUTT,putative [Babesia bigemina]